MVSSAGETDLQHVLETGTRTCEAGADAAPSLHFRAAEDDLEHRLSEAVLKTCEAGTHVAPFVHFALAQQQFGQWSDKR